MCRLFLCCQQLLASFQDNMSANPLHLQKERVEGIWEQDQWTDLHLTCTMNPFASQDLWLFSLSAAEMLRIPDFRENSPGEMGQGREALSKKIE